MPEEKSLYMRIYDLVRLIPYGKVATYGQISKLIGGCTARMVGYALSALKTTHDLEDVPWHRVINAQGKVSIFGDGFGNTIQKELLKQEGVEFDEQGRVNFDDFRWDGLTKV